MSYYIFIIWKDDSARSNEVHGVVEISQEELCDIIKKHIEENSGLEIAHTELRAVTNSPESFEIDIPRILKNKH